MTLTITQDETRRVGSDSHRWDYHSRRFRTADGHTVRVVGDDVHDCTCDDFFCTDTCCHTEAVLAQINDN